MANYLSNPILLDQIWLSKLSTCSFTDPEDRKAVRRGVIPDHLRVTLGPTTRIHPEYSRLPAKAEDGTVVRVERNHKQACPKERLTPFVLYQRREGEWVEVARSHQRPRRLTDELGNAIMLLVERIGRKPNWHGYSFLSEMKGEAIITLVDNILKFDERRTDNPFAFMTQITGNAFLYYMRQETTQARIRTAMLRGAGMKVSNRDEYDHLDYSGKERDDAQPKVKTKPIRRNS